MGCGRGGSWIQEEIGGKMGEMSLIKVYCMYKFPKKLKCYILKFPSCFDNLIYSCHLF